MRGADETPMKYSVAFLLALATGCLDVTIPRRGDTVIALPPIPPPPPSAACPRIVAGLRLVDTVVHGSRPYGVAIAGNNVLVTQLDARRVLRFTLPSLEAIAVAVGDVPTGISIDPAGQRAVVTNQGSNTAGVISVASGVQTADLPMGGPTFRSVIRSDGARAWVTQAHGMIFTVDLAAQTLVDSAASILFSNGLALVGDTLLAVTSTSGIIALVDARTLDERLRFTGQGAYQDVVVRPSADRIYIAREDRPIIEVRRLTTLALVDSIPVPGATFGLALRPNTLELWAAHPGSFSSGALSVTNLGTGVTTCTPVWDPRRIAFSADGLQGVVSSQSGEIFFLRP